MVSPPLVLVQVVAPVAVTVAMRATPVEVHGVIVFLRSR